MRRVAQRAAYAAASCLLLMACAVFAHPGGLDASGCHTNRSTAEYHCHSQPGALGGDKSPGENELLGRVVAVTDGDTIKVLDANYVVHRVRLNGIDAPEKSQAFGSASRKHLESIVAGQEVLVRSIKYDRYGRILGDVWVRPLDCPTCGKTLHINHAQILAGMAWWYRYYAGEQGAQERGQFESAEREAIARKRGLWADLQPVPPWVWRRQ